MRITGINVDQQMCPITGSEAEIDPKTPPGALAEFYCAYNRRDIAMMEQNWVTSGDSSVDHPLGEIRRGWPKIRELYERIFASPASPHVEFYDYVIYQFDGVFLAVGRERGISESPHATLELQSHTSRLFIRANGRWRQFHYHGSIDDPKMLQLFQAAIQ